MKAREPDSDDNMEYETRAPGFQPLPECPRPPHHVYTQQMSERPPICDPPAEDLPGLSARAISRIHEHVLQPLLDEPKFKDSYYTAINSCSFGIQVKQLICFRDVEKHLLNQPAVSSLLRISLGKLLISFKLWLKNATLWLDFCFTSIQCIQATVEFLEDSELTRPYDEPYTTAYFVDLRERIKKEVAGWFPAAEENKEKGEKLEEVKSLQR